MNNLCTVVTLRTHANVFISLRKKSSLGAEINEITFSVWYSCNVLQFVLILYCMMALSQF